MHRIKLLEMHVIKWTGKNIRRITHNQNIKYNASYTNNTEAGLNLKCDECNFEAENERELGWHMRRHHGWPSDEKAECMNISLASTDPRTCEICGYEAESLYFLDGHTWVVHDDSIECDFCENTFENESDLNRHKKEEHCKDPPLQPENGDDQPLHLSCQYCDNKFVLLRELMVHKKRQHEERINICWNYASGKCDFGSENCWFLHTERSETIFECNTCEKNI